MKDRIYRSGGTVVARLEGGILTKFCTRSGRLQCIGKIGSHGIDKPQFDDAVRNGAKTIRFSEKGGKEYEISVDEATRVKVERDFSCGRRVFIPLHLCREMEPETVGQ